MVRNRSLAIGVKGTVFFLFFQKCLEISRDFAKDNGVSNRNVRFLETLALGILLLILINRE